MDAEHKVLYEIRGKISEYAYQAKVLFNKINEYEHNTEIMALSEIGINISTKIAKKSEQLGILLEKIE